jgi:hypothetical protein
VQSPLQFYGSSPTGLKIIPHKYPPEVRKSAVAEIVGTYTSNKWLNLLPQRVIGSHMAAQAHRWCPWHALPLPVAVRTTRYRCTPVKWSLRSSYLCRDAVVELGDADVDVYISTCRGGRSVAGGARMGTWWWRPS